jgi:predicted RNA-binding Zn-ribbon protein involved in translation (DUF1610 family)
MRVHTQTILRNSIKCLSCNEEIESKHVHDFKYCSCGRSAVDGGKEYRKRVGDNWLDTSIIRDDVYEQ